MLASVVQCFFLLDSYSYRAVVRFLACVLFRGLLGQEIGLETDAGPCHVLEIVLNVSDIPEFVPN